MKPVFDRHAGFSQRIAEVDLHAHHSRQIGAGDAGPQHAGAPDTRKGTDPLRGEAKPLMPSDDQGQYGRQVLHISARKVADEVEGQVDPFDGIDPNDLAERLEGTERPGQCRADGVGNLDRKKDAPAFGVIRRHGCRP